MRGRWLLGVFATSVATGVVACGLTLAGEGSSGSSSGSPDGSRTTLNPPATDPDAEPGTTMCTNTMTDPLHCGRCGHSCLGGACAAGRCEPLTFLGGLKSPIGVAVDAKRIYWTAQNAVFSMPIAGGIQAAEVADAGNGTTYLIVENDEVFWSRNLGTIGSINGRVLPNGPVRPIVTDQDHVSGLLKVGPTFYFTLQWIDSMARTFPDGGTGIITGNLDFPETIATDGSSIYVAAPGGEIFSVGLAGGPATKLAGKLLGPTGASESPCGIAVAGDTLFVTLRDTGRVVTLPKTGGDVTEIASGQPKPHGIAVDDKAIYWANNAAGTIMRLAR